MSRFLWASLALVALSTAAHAETRLFSVRTSQTDVTIVQAARNGVNLPVAGQNGGATFFRIDNPQGAVPCNNRIRFTTSAGQALDRVVDLCASNWEVTLTVAGSGNTAQVPAQAPAPTPTPKPAAPAPAATTNVAVTGAQPIAVATDDPNASITNVFLRGQEVPIVARAEPYVQVNLLGGPQGFACTRDLGLALSDGRRIARDVDVCAANFVVVVPLVGGPRPPAPPATMRPRATVQPLPQAQVQPQPPVPQPSPAGPELVTGMQWMFSASGANASVAYALPNTDASEFTAACALRSRQVTVTLTRSADELGPGGTVPVDITAGAFSRTYTATGSEVSEMDGVSHPVLKMSVSDPLWASLIKEKAVTFAIGSSAPYALSLAGSSAQVKQFLAACSPPTPVPSPPMVMQEPSEILPPPQNLPPPRPGPATAAIGYACDDGSYISVAFSGNTVAVYDQGSAPVVLFAVPSNQGSRWVAGQSQLVGLGEQVYWTQQGYTRACQRG